MLRCRATFRHFCHEHGTRTTTFGLSIRAERSLKGGLSAAEASAAIDAALQSADPGVILGMLDSLTSVPLAAWIGFRGGAPGESLKMLAHHAEAANDTAGQAEANAKKFEAERSCASCWMCEVLGSNSAVPWPCLLPIAGAEGGLGYRRDRCGQPGPQPTLPMQNPHLVFLVFCMRRPSEIRQCGD